MIVMCARCGELVFLPQPLAMVADIDTRQAQDFRRVGDALAAHFRSRHLQDLEMPVGCGMLFSHYLLALQATSTDPEYAAVREKVRLQLIDALQPLDVLLARVQVPEVQCPAL